MLQRRTTAALAATGIDVEGAEGCNIHDDGGPAPVFYHGTSLEAAMLIQEEGFRVDLSGTNAGAMLGPGL